MRMVLNWAYRRYRRKIIVTENGIADASEEKRPRYLLSHLEEFIKRSKRIGYPSRDTSTGA